MPRKACFFHACVGGFSFSFGPGFTPLFRKSGFFCAEAGFSGVPAVLFKRHKT